MDDYNIVSLQESNNEWVSRLINMLSPCVISGVREMLNEALKVCIQNDEEEKYLMTFQNILSRVPKWSNETLNIEVDRIKNMSKCEYLEDLISCVHIVQLKALTCIRVGQKQKTIDIDIPKFDAFVHKVYIHLARKLFSNVYLFEASATPLNTQKNNREVELITKDCILEAVRESIPVEAILRAYLDKTIEENVEQEIVHENVEIEKKSADTASTDAANSAIADLKTELEGGKVVTDENSVLMTPVVNNEDTLASAKTDVNAISTPVSVVSSVSSPINANSVASPDPIVMEANTSVPSISNTPNVSPPSYETTTFSNTSLEPNQTISFSNIDEVQNAETKIVSNELAPKDVVSLERRAQENYQKQLASNEDEDDYDNERLKIHKDENIVLDIETL